MRRYRIERHPLVEGDLDAIQDYIAPFAGVDGTLKIIRTIRRRIEELAGFPHIGTVRNEIVPGLRALPAAEKATICFVVNDEIRTVKIVCVTYAGQDWQQIARSREQAA
jgi:plasmid stabilization system protein ParE